MDAVPAPAPAQLTAVPSDAGSLEAFERFYRAEHAAVLAVVAALTGDRAVAEEITQEAFATAHRRWRRVAAYDQPGAWVRRVAVNRAISTFRTRQAERRALDRLEGRPPAAPAPAQTFDDELWTAIRALPPRQAQAVVLTYVEDLPVASVAQVLGCREGTVKSHLNRARQTLAARLAPADESDPR